MLYKPHQDEISAAVTMTREDLLQYVVFRILETEEVWGLKTGADWLTYQVSDSIVCPVWPYQFFAEKAARGDWSGLQPVGESLEYFVFRTLDRLVARRALIEVMPNVDRDAPCLLKAVQFFNMLESMMTGD